MPALTTINKSLKGKIWQQRQVLEEVVASFKAQLGISDLLARLVATKINDPLLAVSYLEPKLQNIIPQDEIKLKSMPEGVQRVIKAISEQEKVCIFFFFDVDSATSSALLKNILRQLNLSAEIYVPDRIEEGYGPTTGAMEKIQQSGASLVITVDCGAVSFEPLAHAAKIGLDVVVIDHHLSLEHLPEAIAVINPNRLDETSEYKYLAAVGVAFLFCIELIRRLQKDGFFKKNNLPPPDLIEQMDIIALGTVCDVMPLIGLNRAIVATGIKVARQRRNIGLRLLADVAGLNEAINGYHFGFVLGPRINAGGRVGKASLGANLLSCQSPEIASKIAIELDGYNNERKAIEQEMLEFALNMADSQQDDAMIFVSSKGWHPGVIGIVAARLKEKHNKPVAVIAIDDNDICKASCRSVKGVDFGSVVIEAKAKGLLEAGGGHAMAAGFTAKSVKMIELQAFMNDKFSKMMQNNSIHLANHYDMTISANAVNLELMQEINKLEPCGTGNSLPIFNIENMQVKWANIVGQKHISLTLASGYSNRQLKAIAFNAVGSELGEFLMQSNKEQFSAIGHLKKNIWQGRQEIQLHLLDVLL